MDQYPKWFLALNFPNIILAMVLMVFFMFGGLHPLGDVESIFWSFVLYVITQLIWVLPIILFFISIFAWGWARERLAIGCCCAGWLINMLALYIVVAS